MVVTPPNDFLLDRFHGATKSPIFWGASAGIKVNPCMPHKFHSCHVNQPTPMLSTQFKGIFLQFSCKRWQKMQWPYYQLFNPKVCVWRNQWNGTYTWVGAMAIKKVKSHCLCLCICDCLRLCLCHSITGSMYWPWSVCSTGYCCQLKCHNFPSLTWAFESKIGPLGWQT